MRGDRGGFGQGPAEDGGVAAEVHERGDLRTADCASAASAEDDFALCVPRG